MKTRNEKELEEAFDECFLDFKEEYLTAVLDEAELSEVEKEIAENLIYEWLKKRFLAGEELFDERIDGYLIGKFVKEAKETAEMERNAAIAALKNAEAELKTPSGTLLKWLKN